MSTDYSKTVHLPKTAFPMKADLARREPEVLERWKSSRLYQKMTERRRSQKAPAFVLHDGPPYANGHVHVGTALNKILKDIIVKYKTMTGFFAPYVPGWDCHGLPIEFQVLKAKGLKKQDIDRLRLRKDAHAFAEKFLDVQRQEFIRLGVLSDWENPYLTMEKSYVAAQLRAFQKLTEKKGLVYRGKKPVYWCATCETALADAEVEYAEKQSDSITVAFPLKNKPGVSVAVWTTTPWTLPANVALAFNPRASYATFQTSKGSFVAAESRREALAKILGTDLTPTEIKKGQDWAGQIAQHPFLDRESRLVTAEYVSLEDGTGVVHIAPGHGLEDYGVGLKEHLPVLSPVDDRGCFTDEVPAYQGVNVFEANALIIEDLKKANRLLDHHKITHSYPHCWRCKNPVIFRATEQWFLGMETTNPPLRQKLLESLKGVRWTPTYGENRIRGMLENRPDWCLSRQRYWGVPIPVFYCETCQEPIVDSKVISHVADLVEKEGPDVWFSKSAAELVPSGTQCPKGHKGGLRKEESILDVWFDSGVSHESVLPRISGSWKPASLYLEGSDQHRGWFQTSLITAMALHDQPPYREVLTHGFVVDGDGRKMSKSLGNVIAPEEIIKNHGAEILRLWVAVSDYRDDIRISKEILDRCVESYRKIRNTLRFLLGNLSDFDPTRDRVNDSDLWDLDRWALAELGRLTTAVRKHYDAYEFHQAAARLNEFAASSLSEFYFDVLKDRLYTYAQNAVGRRSAQTALWSVARDLIRLIAPVLSFTAQEAWDQLKADHPNQDLSESPFLEDFPEARALPETFDVAALKALRQKVNEKLEAARKEGLIGKSLEAKLRIETGNAEERERLNRLMKDEQLASFLIVSHVELISGSAFGVQVSRADGKKCARCWRWTQDVGGSHPELCGRCVQAIAVSA